MNILSDSSNAAVFDRRPLPLARLLRAYAMEAKFEMLGALRTTGFALPFIAAPVAIYVLFAVVISGNAAAHSPLGPGIADYLFAGFASMAAMMPGIFSGVILAQEREGGLLKLKRFQDSEARVLEVVEEQFNGNEAQKDNLGRTKRSSAKAGKVGKGRAGALRVRDLTTGVEFEVGTGLTDQDKAEWWAWWLKVNRAPSVCERVIRYKFFSVGMQERPRHPVFVSMRDARDL